MKNVLNLAWLDLEMTGLDVNQNVILEIASIVTDKDLNILAHGPNFVIHQNEQELQKMVDVVAKIHSRHGLIDEVRKSEISVEYAQQETIKFFEQFCFIGVSPLCGNSIWNDRIFLREYMPQLDNFFSYRIIDVSSVKELVRRWYTKNTDFVKPEVHRAMSDVQASIEELKFYRKNFFIL